MLDPVSIVGVTAATFQFAGVSKKLFKAADCFCEASATLEGYREYCNAVQFAIERIKAWVHQTIAQDPSAADKMSNLQSLIEDYSKHLGKLKEDVDKRLGKEGEGREFGTCKKLRFVLKESSMQRHLNMLVYLQGVVQLVLNATQLPVEQSSQATEQLADDASSISSSSSSQAVFNIAIHDRPNFPTGELTLNDVLSSSRPYRRLAALPSVAKETEASRLSQGFDDIETELYSESDEVSSIDTAPHGRKRRATRKTQAPRKKRTTASVGQPRNGVEIAAVFGDLAEMASMLSDALSTRRQQHEKLPTEFRTLWAQCRVDFSSYSSIRSRFMKAEVIRQWLEILEEEKSSPTRCKYSERAIMTEKLDVDDDVTTWQRIRKCKSRYRIWFDLCRLFQKDLGKNALVAVCAFVGSGTHLENGSRKERHSFLAAVKARKTSILPQLRAIIRTFNYIVEKLDSLETLNIESRKLDLEEGSARFSDLSIEEFQACFSLKEQNVQLP